MISKGGTMRMKRYLIFVTALLVSGVMAGCGSFTFNGEDGEKTKVNVGDLKDGKLSVETEDEDGEKGSVNIDTDEDGGTSMSVDSGDEQFDIEAGENTELPEGFPKDFPIPDSAAIMMASTTTEEAIVTYSVQ